MMPLETFLSLFNYPYALVDKISALKHFLGHSFVKQHLTLPK